MRNRFQTLRRAGIVLILAFASITSLWAQTPLGTEIKNIATARYIYPGDFDINISSQEVVTVVEPGYTLNISKTVASPSYSPRDTVEYHIEISNSGDLPVYSFILSDTLAGVLNYIGSQPAAQVDGHVLTWNNLDLEPGATMHFDISCVVPSGFSSETEIVNKAYVETPELVKIASAPASIIIENKALLQISKTARKQSVLAGDTLDYEIVLGNLGNIPAYDAILVDELPYKLLFVSADTDIQKQDRTISWSIGDIHPGDIIERNIKLSIRDDAQTGTVTNRATVSSNNDSEHDSETVEVRAQAALDMHRTMPAFASPCDTVSYMIHYGNRGGDDASDLLMTEVLNENFQYLSSESNGLYDPASHEIRWNFPSLSAGEKDSVEISVLIKKSVPDGTNMRSRSHIYCAEGKKASAYSDILLRSALLTIEKSADSTSVQAGEELNYKIDYLNSGHGLARNVTITDTLSVNLDFVSATGNYHFNANHGVVQWYLHDVDALMTNKEQVSLTVRVREPLTDASVLMNKVSIESECGFYAEDTARVKVKSAPELSLIKSSQSSAFLGDTLTYTFNYINNGNAIANSAILLDTLSDHLEFISASGNSSYDADGHIVSWDLGDIALNTESTVELKAKINRDHIALKELSNKASLHFMELKAESNIFKTKIHAYDLSISADPDTLLGNGESVTTIRASVFSDIGQAIDDGTEVTFFTERGTFLSDTHTVKTLNGYADMQLRSEIVSVDYVPVKVSAKIIAGDGDVMSDSTDVVFSAYRAEGVVLDREGNPAVGVTILLIQDGEVLGTAITDENGEYSIAIYKPGPYIIRIVFRDRFGDTHTVDQGIEAGDTGTGQVGDVTYNAAVSGRLVDRMSGEVILLSDVDVYLNRIEKNSLNKINLATDFTEYVDSTHTDTNGFFFFNDLDLGTYRIEAVFGESNYFYSGSREFTLENSGVHLIDTDIYNDPVLFKTYKTVDKEIALKGDSLKYTIHFESLNRNIADTIYLVDQLPQEVEFIASSFNDGEGMYLKDYNRIRRELSFYRYGMKAQEKDSVVFLAKLISNTEKDITNTAFIYTDHDSVYTQDDSRTRATSSIIAPFLLVEKTVNIQVAEVGDILTYNIKISNQSDDQSIKKFILTDRLPSGFRYRENRSFMDAAKIADPEMLMQNGRQTLVWNIDEEIPIGQSIHIKYRTVVGLNTRFGENENTAFARGFFRTGDQVASNTASATVVVKPGMMQGYGLIFGKVFFDRNGNNMHDNDEETFKGVEIISETGIRVTTDEYGKYSIPSVRMGDHVLKVNTKTLPKNTRVVVSSSDFMGDSDTRLVKLSATGIAKANFVLAGDDFVPERKVIVEAKSKKEGKGIKNTAQLNISQETVTRSLRMASYHPWEMTIALKYDLNKNGYEITNSSELEDIKNYLTWRQDVTVLVEEFSKTDVPALCSTAKSETCPVNTVSSELLALGIEERRLKCRYTANNSSLENNAQRLVRLKFFPAPVAPDERQVIDMRFNMDYSGSILLNDVKFVTYLPKGFSLDENSAKVNFAKTPVKKLNDTAIEWDLGKLSESEKNEISFKLVPTKADKITTHSSIISMLEYKIEAGKFRQTPLMMNTLETKVDHILFNEIMGDSHFEFHSPELLDGNDPAIAAIAKFLRWQPWVSIIIEGYSDNIGSWKVAKVLSQRRAEAIRDVLVNKYHIAADRIEAKGFGAAYPVADNKTAEGRRANRRVEIRAIANEKQMLHESNELFEDSIEIRIEQETR